MRWGTASRYAFFPGALAVAVLDQVTKLLVVSLISLEESIDVLGPVLSLTYTRNTGGAFSLAPGSTGGLVVVSVLVVVFLVLYGIRGPVPSRVVGYGLAFLLGGALGNLADRAFRGWVVDFLDFHFWPVFNVADIAITIGAVLIGWHILMPPKTARADDAEADSPGRATT